jgi:hypothetical protein
MKHTFYFETIQQAKRAECALYHMAIECLSHEVRLLDGEPVLQFWTKQVLRNLTCSMLEYEAMPEISSFNEAPDGENTEDVVYVHSLSFSYFLDFDKAREAQACIKQEFDAASSILSADNHHAYEVRFLTKQWLPIAQQKALKQASQADLAAFNHIRD